MRRVTFGISPECLCHDVRDNVRRVRALEEAGFDYIWEGDHTLPWQHSAGHSSGIFTTLAAFLANTERATVGGMVIPALGIRHHPHRRRHRGRHPGVALSRPSGPLPGNGRGHEREDDHRRLALPPGAH